MIPALTELCLRTILEHFPRYNLVFKTTKDNDMKRRFEFLQRKYSYELLTRLSGQQESLEEYVDLLVNKHLKVLDTSWLRNCTWEKVTSKIAEIGSNVKKIFFPRFYEEFHEDGPWEDIICHLPNLKTFTFQRDCDVLFLENVANFCRDIEKINIQGALIRDFQHSLHSFVKNEHGESLCTKLRKLTINEIPDIDLKYLIKNLPSLEIIHCLRLPFVLYSLHKNDLPSLDRVQPYNITRLDLSVLIYSYDVTDVKKVCLSVCPHLKSLKFPLSLKEELHFFSSLSDLERLYIGNYSNSEISIDELLISKGEKLTYLNIKNCTVSVTVIAESCPRLKELVMNQMNFLFGIHSKSVFSSLSSLTIKSCDVSMNNRAVNFLLSQSAKLESLSFDTCDAFTCDTKVYILNCCEIWPIEKISFYHCDIDIDYIKDILLSCHTLNSLGICGCFERHEEEELFRFAEILPNKPKIDVGEPHPVTNLMSYLPQFYDISPSKNY